MNCVSCDICVYHLGLFEFFPRVFLSSRLTWACPVTTDLIMRVNVKTTTTNNIPLAADLPATQPAARENPYSTITNYNSQTRELAFWAEAPWPCWACSVYDVLLYNTEWLLDTKKARHKNFCARCWLRLVTDTGSTRRASTKKRWCAPWEVSSK